MAATGKLSMQGQDALDATHRRIETEANLRKQALLRADADVEIERLARERLDAARQAVEQHRLLELAENEAASLAKIRANTERGLAVQEQARAAAERARETAAILRTQQENEAAQQARIHETAAHEARQAAAAREAAEREAEAAALASRDAAARLAEERRVRRQAELDAAKARRSRLLAQLASAWAAIRYASPLAAGATALAAGIAVGLWLAWSGPSAPSSAAPYAIDAAGVEVRLQLDRAVQTPGR
ncbi:MAG: hypothetical protein HZC24_06915 [Rhodocyclales bacterium]|nr:hypothetical protein [Rhodocyclales bacterium]